MARTSTSKAVALVGLVLAACAAPDGSITGAVSRSSSASVLDMAPATVELCKVGPLGTFATFTIVADGGTLPLGNSVTVAAQPAEILDRDACPIVWRAIEPAIVPEVTNQVTITESDMTHGTTLEKIFVGTHEISEFLYPPINSVTVSVKYSSGANIKFYNIGTPSGGGEGCTPGYWKQSQHFDSWTAPYTPTSAFSSVFADAFPGMTLLDVLSQGGGGANALGRHTVAALLNAAATDVDNGMASDDVIAAFNTAFASGEFENQKNIFAASNEMGCPLN